MNKVLNRPMFRKVALQRGDLKPIHANTGVMVGSSGPNINYGPPNPRFQISTEVKPQGFFRKLGREFSQSRRGIQQIMNPKSPQFTAKGTLGSGRLIPGLLGVEGVHSVVDPVVGQYMKEGLPRDLVSYGISGLASLNPYVRAAGLGKFGFDLAKEQVYKPVAASIKKYRDTPVSERRVLPDISGEASMDGIGVEGAEGAPDKVVNKSEVKIRRPKNPRGMGRKNINDNLTLAENDSKVVDGAVDIDKVVKNNVDPNGLPPNLSTNMGGDNQQQVKQTSKKDLSDDQPKIDKEITNEQANKKIVTDQVENDLDKPGNIKAEDGTEVNTEVIDLAKAYRKELMAGQKSQAKLVFLANLASGLLSGKTQQGGLSGALEIFGAALGPAVNNYATIKLKENELENEFMSDALELASDEIERRNEILEVKVPEYPDGTPGTVQFFDENGNTVNMAALELKDGTVQVAMPGELDNFGRRVYRSMAPGTYNRFVGNDKLDPERLKVLSELDGKYKALSLGIKSIDLLEEFQAKGKTGAGPLGRFNLFKSRLGDAMFDMTGMKMFTNEDEAQAKANEYRDLLINDWLKSNEGYDRKSAGEEIDKLLGDSVVKDKIMNSISEYTGEKDKQALSQLAINETVMVYALANSLKSKDRLTAMDIRMAKDLVNIFPLLRGQASVIKDLRSVNNTILGDISSLENNYIESLMGETATMRKYRQRYGIVTGQASMGQPTIENPYKDLSEEDLLEGFGTIQ